MIAHHRRQYPVGQGCFHAGIVGPGHGPPDRLLAGDGVRYVYDCGSMKPYAAARTAAIGQFHADCDRRQIDLLFLSHQHEDHVSGVEALCDPATGCDVDTIILALLNVIDRLICFARAEAESNAGAGELMAALAVDPATALVRLNPHQIIFVRRGEGPAPPPGAALPPAPEDGPYGAGPGERGRRTVKWRLGGEGFAQHLVTKVASDNLEQPGAAQAVFVVDDTLAIEIRDAVELLRWILAPYVDVEVSLARDAFLKAAGDLFGLTPEAFEAKAYETVANLNVTSLCLYSGPAGDVVYQPEWRAEIGRLSSHGAPACVGWLGTGDADLKRYARREAFLQHYAGYLASVQTLLLPQHGSAHNFSADLLQQLQPFLTIAAADAGRNESHDCVMVFLRVYNDLEALSETR